MPPSSPAPPEPAWVARTRARTRRYWDAHPIAVDTVEHAPGTRESFDAIYARMIAAHDDVQRAWIEVCRGKRVLEMGCGIAVHGRFLAAHGIDYTGIDYSRRSLELARSHFAMNGLRGRFVNGDGAALPFADGVFDVVFSEGVVHHIPDMRRACQELVRVASPGATLRVMVYARHSYHYALVRFVIAPLLWLLLRLPFGVALAQRMPAKVRHLFSIVREQGFDLERILSASTDTSSAGEGNFNPHSYFVTARELEQMLAGLEAPSFRRRELRGFPIGPLRPFMERHFGFFLVLTGTKSGRRGG